MDLGSRIDEFLMKAFNSRAFRWALFSAVLLFIAAESGQERNDLDIFLEASRSLFAGKDIYSERYFGIYHYFYSVFFATILYPLTMLPIYWARFLWLTGGVLVMIRMLSLLLRLMPDQELKKAGKGLVVFLLVLFSLRFLRSNLHLGQVNHWIMWLSLEAMFLIWSGRKLWGGAILALAINIKLLPVVFIPYLIYRREFRATIFSVFCLLFFYVSPAAWIGQDRNGDLLSSYWNRIDPMQDRHVFDHEETSFHSLTTLISTFFMEDVREHNGLDIRRHIVGVPEDQLPVIITAVRLLFVLLTLWFLRSRPFVQVSDNKRRLYEIAYLLLAGSLIFPHQQHYAFITLCPAILWLIVAYRNSRRSVLFLFTLCIVYFAINLGMLAGGLNPWLNHFKVLTWASLLVLILMIRHHPFGTGTMALNQHSAG
jgi:hypothetical protein